MNPRLANSTDSRISIIAMVVVLPRVICYIVHNIEPSRSVDHHLNASTDGVVSWTCKGSSSARNPHPALH